MKSLVMTTALALILSAPVSAQTAGTEQTGTTTGQMRAGAEGGYYASMQQGDLRASELMDATVYAPQTGQAGQEMGTTAGTTETTAQTGTGTTTGTTGTTTQTGQTSVDQQGQAVSRWGRSMNTQDLESMENIGNVTDLLLDQQGRVQALLVDVGGFLGMGARTVALGMDQVNFVTDQQDPSQIYVVSRMGADSLESAPEFDQTTGMEGRGQQQAAMDQQQTTTAQTTGQQQVAPQQDQTWRGDRQAYTPPAIEREGYQRAEANRVSVDNVIGANVYDINDENIGDVSDVVLGPNGEAQYVVLDVGGFLGIGTHTVAIGFDEMTVLQGGTMEDLRIYVDATQESLEAMPEHEVN